MAKAIMVQGTMSNAGKSLITAGICRVLKQDGYRVAPFKAQNMALNSYITKERLEMGRAQAVQAEACDIEPDVRMNPILLKPTTHVGSQVIVNGEVLGDISAANYYAMKSTLVPEIERAYRSLAQEYDVIVIEGAGSPAEINLKQDDLVNMGMAKRAKSPVLLVGDIDRGGVFAQLYGTIALLDDEERAMVKAFIINKFRGDVELLKPGLRMIEDLTNKPVAGVLPYLDIDIDDEDSLSERLTRTVHNAVIDIAVVRLPHISNFTDFAAFEATPGVGVRYVRSPAELQSPDMIILPGTKSTISDLLWLRQSGLETAILRLAAQGTVVFGICGGYQMLGAQLSDAAGTEGGGETAGMGLLPVCTEFFSEKCRTRVTAKALQIGGALSPLSGAELEGYEIHMGRTQLLSGATPLCMLENGSMDGCQQGSVYGSYLHGFFDSAACREAMLRALCAKKGLPSIAAFDLKAYRQQQYDKLAQAMRSDLDFALIRDIMEKGI
jgi:adenosylcobyric acid synthase